MDISARVTAKGQVTIPKQVRRALGISVGDQILFRVVEDRVILARTADLLDLAGSVDVPAAKRGTPWDEVRRQTRQARAHSRR